MEIRDILKKYNFRHNKALGQNFITDKNLLSSIVNDAQITNDDVVVEIGAGAGTLTRELAKKAKKVIAFEVDRNLENILKEVLAPFDNVSVHFDDVLNLSDESLNDIIGGQFKVVANLPYYITTPLIMRFLESNLPLVSLTLMMQKEVAVRLIAKSGSSEYGAITVGVDVCGDAKITRNIPNTMFYPIPKVDSALLKIDIRRDKYDIEDIQKFKKLVKAAFMWRRKTLSNNIVSAFRMPKDKVDEIIKNNNLDVMVRGERLSTEQFITLSKSL